MKFISFGCWNKGDPKKSEYPIKHLLDELNKFISNRLVKSQRVVRSSIWDGAIDFIVITGDNYYPNIKKIYSEEDTLTDIINKPEEDYQWQPFKEVINYSISSGGGKVAYCNLNHLDHVFSKLKNISDTYDIPIYMCSGNHEYKEHTIFIPEIVSPPIERPKNPLEYELPHKSNLLDIQKGLFNCNRCTFIESGRLIEGLPFFVINTEEEHIDSNEHIIELINKETGEIYIFGHIPILSLKVKKEKHMVVNKYLVDLFCKLKEGITVTYICADTHNYQDITITFENGTLVNQVILGTGGTFPLDDIVDDRDKLNSLSLPDKINHIHIKKAITGNHGFGLFDTDIRDHKFIEFFDTALGGYKLKKSKNKKNKKIITKRRYNKRKTKRRTNKRKTKKRKNNK